jgi:hypothetical protein
LSRQKINVAKLVPAFGELRRVLDHFFVVNERFCVIETQLRLARLLQQLPRFVVGKAAPEGPQVLFDLARFGVAFRRGERGKERCSFPGRALTQTHRRRQRRRLGGPQDRAPKHQQQCGCADAKYHVAIMPAGARWRGS